MSAAMGASNASTSLLGGTWTNAYDLHKNIEMQYLKPKLEPTKTQGGTCASRWMVQLNQIRKMKTRSGCPWKSGQKGIVIQRFRRCPG
jgi:hypothetical protein